MTATLERWTKKGQTIVTIEDPDDSFRTLVTTLGNHSLHREDGPAMIFDEGKLLTKWWFKNGVQHRQKGPAVEISDGTRFWFIDGKDITDEVEQWLTTNNYSYPFDKNTQFAFTMRF